MRVDFYIIEKPRFSQDPLLLVCELTKKACAATQSILIRCQDHTQAEELDDLLWSFEEDAFIPHQIAGEEGDDDAKVLLVPPGIDTKPRALVINLHHSCVGHRSDRILEIVTADAAARQHSRQRWREYQQRGSQINSHRL